MTDFQILTIPGYEKVIEAVDRETGLHCFIAIHNTTLGPALGGVRLWNYPNREEALNDVLRLAEAMTYKSAFIKDGLGGGKAVIIANPEQKTRELLLSFAHVVDSLKGKYICAEDVGTTTEDMDLISTATPYVAATSAEKSSGDPSRFTAWGVFCGMKAVANTLWGSPSLRGKMISIQGIGNVGSKLARLLFWHGAELTVCDVLSQKAHELTIRYGAKEISPEEFTSTPCDILSPCALGGIFNDQNIERLQCKAIAGSANNQLLDSTFADLFKEKGILYAPDYVINAGGVINAAIEFDPEGYNPKKSRDKVEHIYETLINLFEKSISEQKSTQQVADEFAEYKLFHGIGKRTQPLTFHRSKG